MIRILLLSLALPVGAWAASPEELERLHEALSSDELMQILSEEGIEQSQDLQAEMFPGRGGVGWAATANRIYAPERLERIFRDAFAAALEDNDMASVLEFYEGETGSKIARLEIDARRAIMSEDVENAAREAFQQIEDDGSPRVDLLETFADLNDLVDRNVTGALNASLAFYRGLASGDGFDMSEEQMLGEVWGQEADIREDTTGWIFGYMTFAYETLSDDELRAYVDMAGTEAGGDLNRALFAGFDAVFLDVSYALGQATARFSVGDEL